MNGLLTYLIIQLKMDLRDKGTLSNYYLVPLVFFLVVGSVFASINPLMKTTLAATMTVFAVTMGSVMGFPTPLVKLRESGTLRAFKASGIPSSAVMLAHTLSAFVHLMIVSLIIYVLSPILFHSAMPQNSWLYLVTCVVLVLASLSIGLAIGVSSRNHSFSTMISMFVFLPSLLLGGVMFPASMLPNFLADSGRIFPANYALQAFNGLAYHTPTKDNPIVALAVVVGIAIVLFALSTWQMNRLEKR